MQYRNLGKTGLRVSLMGLGGIPLQRVSEAEAKKIILTAVEKGINFIDTARAYTDSEAKIGESLIGLRDKVVLASKTMARTKEKMLNDIEISLRNLKTDYIDLYQCHNVRTQEEMDIVLAPGGALEALSDAQKAGKVRHIGLTGHRVPVLSDGIKTGVFATIQVPYNYMERSPEEELLPLARKEGLGIIVMKPLAGGAFSKSDLALRFLMHQDVTSIIPGMDSVEQVLQNTELVRENRELTASELEYLVEEARKIGNRFCRRCDYCKPCPQGIDIASSFVLHGYYTRYGLPEWSRERYNALKVKASDCIECGLCESRCPYSLPIREMLKEVHRDLG